jgi:putative DNA primase/helicase
MNATPLEKVLAAIGNHNRSGESYTARCAAHEDHTPSLSVSTAEDGKVLLKCHAGCPTEAVVKALGLEMRDLFSR